MCSLDFQESLDPIYRGLPDALRARVLEMGAWSILHTVPPELIHPDQNTQKPLFKGPFIHGIWCLLYDDSTRVPCDTSVEKKLTEELQEVVKGESKELRQR